MPLGRGFAETGRVIVFVFTSARRHTHQTISEWAEVGTAVEVWSYTALFAKPELPRATYVFGDFDRLSPWELELAARLFRILEKGGARVLNDPGRALQRYALLRRLKAAGLNSFGAWMLETDGLPDRFPVFLRTASAHRGAMSKLLETPEAVAAAAERLVAKGIPAREIMAVEFSAEPIGAIYRKYAAHRVGKRIMLALSVHDTEWMTKYGANGVAGDALYAEERALIEENRFADDVMDAFSLAHIDYGRADFGLVRGRVEIYEINTNPAMRRTREHSSADRIASDLLWGRRYGEALAAIDSSGEESVAVDDPIFQKQRQKDKAMRKDRYVV